MANISTVTVGGTQYNIKDSSGTYLPLNTAEGVASCSGNGENLYFQIATIKITSAYINRPIVFELSGRGYEFTRIQVIFQSINSTDPALSSFTSNNTLNFYIKKTATSTGVIYGKYNEVGGHYAIHRITGVGANIGVTVNMTNIGTTAPSDIVTVTRSGQAAYADSAGAVAGGNVTGKPSSFTPASHTHDYLPLSGGTLTNNSLIKAGSGSGTEGIRINKATTGYCGLILGGETSTTSGKADYLGWIGVPPQSSGRRLYIAHNGSTDSGTYFYSDSSTQVSPYLRLGSSGSITNGNANAVTGGTVYSALQSYLPLSGGTLTGRLTGNGKITLPTSGGTGISQATTTNAAIQISTKVPTDGNRYDTFIAGTFADDSHGAFGGIEKSLDFTYFAAGRTGNGTDGRIKFDIVNSKVIADLQGNCSGSAGSVAGGNVTGKPSTYAPSSHGHGVNTTNVGSASGGSAGSVPTVTAVACDDITNGSAGTVTTATVSGTKLTITNGTAPSLSYTARSVNSVSSVGTAPSLTVSTVTVATSVKNS